MVELKDRGAEREEEMDCCITDQEDLETSGAPEELGLAGVLALHPLLSAGPPQSD